MFLIQNEMTSVTAFIEKNEEGCFISMKQNEEHVSFQNKVKRGALYQNKMKRGVLNKLWCK